MDTTPATLRERLRRAPDAEAWGKFVDLYTPLLYHWARKLGLGQDDASDLVQDVLLLLVRKLPEFQHDRHKRFRGWLRTVAHNRWKEGLRRKPPPAQEEGLDDLADGLPGFWEREYEERVVGRATELMRREFEEATWRAFWETTAQGRPPTEVASELGLTPNAVYVARSRVLRRLREELGGMID